MKRVLFFQPVFGGHALEYIAHLYKGALQGKDYYIFYLNIDFKQKQTEYCFCERENIRIVYIPKETTDPFETGRLVSRSFKLNKYLKHIVQAEGINSVFLISFDHYFPLLPLFLVRGVDYSGIYYFIYLYRWKKIFPIKGFLSIRFQAFLISRMNKSQSVKNMFICNDSSAVIYLNRLFHTSKFKFLSDPFNPVPVDKSPEEFRIKHGIGKEQIVVSHIGVMDYRKGTLEILRAIRMLEETVAKKYVFVFAGTIVGAIKSDFMSELSLCPSYCQIIVINEFCKNETLGEICCSSDLILMPYKQTAQSSGMYGYAALFNVPVAVPDIGLLGKIRRKYGLGYSLGRGKQQDIISFLERFPAIKGKRPDGSYLEFNNVDVFLSQIICTL